MFKITQMPLFKPKIVFLPPISKYTYSKPMNYLWTIGLKDN